MSLFRQESCDAKYNAQRNLQGRTHYVDDDTLRYFKARILSSQHAADGLLFALVESVALDPNNSMRGYRFAIFDIFGTVLARPDLEHAFKTSDRARKALRDAIDKIDAKAHTFDAIARQRAQHNREMDELVMKVKALK